MNRKINLLEGPILKKIILLSAPLMATAFIQTTYNLVDMAWLGRLGEGAVAAVGAGGIYSWLAASIATIARVGTNVYTSQYYGSNNKVKLNNVIKNGLLLVIILSLIYTVIVQIFANGLIGFYNLREEVTSMGVVYLRFVALGYIVQFINPVLSAIYNSTGQSVKPFLNNSVGLIINLVLDPLLIFGPGIFPEMGILGAALATVIAQVVVTLLFIIDIIKNKNEIYDAMKDGILKFVELIKIFKMGFPAGIQSALQASIALVLNRFMSEYGSMPLAVYTIGTNIESISWVSAEGLQGGIVAFVGQNYGARKKDRLKEIINKSLRLVFIIGLITTSILIIFRYQLYQVFMPGQREAILVGANLMIIAGISQSFMCMEIGCSGVFQGLGLTKIPSMISIIFNLVRIPLSLILMPYYGYYGIWIAVSISCILKGTISFAIVNFKNIILITKG